MSDGPGWRDYFGPSGDDVQAAAPEPPPMLVEPVSTLDSIHEIVSRLLAASARPRISRVYEASVGGQTNASGHAQILLFQVPAGFDFQATRVVLDMAGFTPAAPSATGYVEITDGQPGALGAKAQVGSVRDFAPTAAGGAVFPQVSVDGEDSGAVYRGGSSVWANMVGCTASRQVAVYIRGLLTEQ